MATHEDAWASLSFVEELEAYCAFEVIVHYGLLNPSLLLIHDLRVTNL